MDGPEICASGPSHSYSLLYKVQYLMYRYANVISGRLSVDTHLTCADIRTVENIIKEANYVTDYFTVPQVGNTKAEGLERQCGCADCRGRKTLASYC